MKKIILFLITLLLCEFFSVKNSLSVPSFARKYGFNCSMCHMGFTKLNDFGQRFRDNGYQIPGQAGKEGTVFETAPPISMRLPLGHTTYNTKAGTANSFNLYGFDLLASGVLLKNVSFIMIYTPRIDEPSAYFSGRDSSNNSASQYGSLETVSLVFSNIIPNVLNLRIGKFEPGYHIFSSKRSYYLFQPNEIYSMTSPKNNYIFDDNQLGIEASGHFKTGFKYTAGVVSGNGSSPDNNNNKDIYLSLSQTFGKGDGQSAGQRIGVFGYYGWQPLTLPGTVIGNMGQTNGSNNKSFSRIGFTGSINYKSLNVQLLYLMGSDDKGFNTLRPTENYKYSGGFIELDYVGLLNNKLVGSVMYNWIQPPDYDSDREFKSYSALCRYYLGDWSAVNVSLHAEFTHRIIGNISKLEENIFALAVDFAF
jgi:hypothetical protein